MTSVRLAAIGLVCTLLTAPVAAGPPTSPYTPITVLPHPGEFFFNVDEQRAKGPPSAMCEEGMIDKFTPAEAPSTLVHHVPNLTRVIGDYFAQNLLVASSFVLAVPEGPRTPREIAIVNRAKNDLVTWARADAFKKFVPDSDAEYWSVYIAFPAMLLAYDGLDRRGMLSEAEKTDITAWMQRLVKRTYIGVELPNVNSVVDTRINNKNSRRNLILMLWAIRTNDPKLFNLAVEKGYVRFLRAMAPNGSINDANRGVWAMRYMALSIGAQLFAAEAAAHQGVDLYAMAVDGKSIHTAVKFFLDAADNPDILKSYYAPGHDIPGLPYIGQQEGWLETGRYGVSWIGWADLYIDRFPDSENARRLRLLREKAILSSTNKARAFIDYSFGNVSCFWGDLKGATAENSAPTRAFSSGDIHVVEHRSALQDSFDVTLAAPKLGDDSLPPLKLRVVAIYTNAKKDPESVSFLELRINSWQFTEQQSKDAAYLACGELASEPDSGAAYLHLEGNLSVNRCVLDKMGAHDRELWQAILAKLPEIAGAAASGSADDKALAAVVAASGTDSAE